MVGLAGLYLLVVMHLFPAWCVLRIRREWLGFLLGTVSYWMLSLMFCDYLRAVDPEYDSFAPALVLVFGWFQGGLYCLFCYVLGHVFKVLRRRRRARAFGEKRPQVQVDGSDETASGK